jgi:hypothetical protein
VRDEWGVPMPNQPVRIGVAGDEEGGTVNGSEVVTATTDASGKVEVLFARGVMTGAVVVRAEVVVQENNQTHGAFAQTVTIQVVGATPSAEKKLYLPLVRR